MPITFTAVNTALGNQQFGAPAKNLNWSVISDISSGTISKIAGVGSAAGDLAFSHPPSPDTGTALWTLANTLGAQSITLEADNTVLQSSDSWSATVFAGPADSSVIDAGNNQTIVAGETNALAMTVSWSDVGANPINNTLDTFGELVEFFGDGSFPAFINVAGGAGASTLIIGGWTVPTTAGAVSLSFTSGSEIAAFDATIIADDPDSGVATGGTGQSATAGLTVAGDITINFDDQYGNDVIDGTQINVVVQVGGGSVATATLFTSGGSVTLPGAQWTLGTVSGVNNNALRFTADGFSAFVDVTASADPDIPNTLIIIQGGSESTTVNTTFATDLQIRSEDQYTNVTPSITINSSVIGGGGSLGAASGATNAGGLTAANAWTAGIIIGANTVRYEVDGDPGTFVDFIGTGDPDIPDALIDSVGQGQSGPINAALPIGLQVISSDQFTNITPNIVIDCSVISGGGSLGSSSGVTDAGGETPANTWTLGTAAGLQSVRYEVDGDPATFFDFSATAAPGPLAAISSIQGDGQFGFINANLPITIVIRGIDGFANGVPGEAWTALDFDGNGALATPAGGVTDSNGDASFIFRLGGLLGVHTIRVTIGAFTFDVTATAMAPPPVPDGDQIGAAITPIPTFTPVPTDAPGAFITTGLSTVESCIDGITNDFTQNIQLVGFGEITINLDYDSDPAGGAMAERESCAFVDSSAVRSIISLVDKNGTAIIGNDGVIETQTIPSEVTFPIEGQRRVIPIDQIPLGEFPLVGPGQVAVPVSGGVEYDVADLEIKISINTTNVNYCRGYRLTITAFSDRSATKVPPTFVITQPEAGILTNPIDIPPIITIPGGSDETIPSITPEPSFAPDGTITAGGKIVDPKFPEAAPLDGSNYALSFGSSQTVVSGTGATKIFMSFPDIDVGQLIKAPSNLQTPLPFDALQDNVLLSIDSFALSKDDAGFGVGHLGNGTYVLGFNMSTTWSSRIPNIPVRRDIWNDVIAFFLEPPEVEDGEDPIPFRFVLTGRLSESTLLDHANSVFADALFDSQISDGIFVLHGDFNGDPMGIINAGSIIDISNANVTITYIEENVDDIYPSILIEKIGEEPLLTPGVEDISVESFSFVTSDTTQYAFEFRPLNGIPEDGQIWIDFPAGFDISGVTGVTSVDIDGSLGFFTSGQTLKILRTGGTEVTGNLGLLVTGVVNSSSASAFTWDISTYTSGTAIIDGPDTSDNSITLTNSLFNAPNTAIPGNTTGGAISVPWTFTINPNFAIPIGAKVVITFGIGDGTAFTLASEAGTVWNNISGTIAASRTVVPTEMTVVRTSGSIVEPKSQSIVIIDMLNGLTGSYTVDIDVQDSGGASLIGGPDSVAYTLT